MKRRAFTILTALMWIALPLTALRYAQVWNQLPSRMATHFAANGQPNGWMSRETSLYFGLGLTVFVLIIFTAIALVIRQQKTMPDAPAFALLGFFYLIVGFVFYGNNSVIEHNLTGRPIAIAPMLLGVPITIVLFTAIYLRAQRGQALPEGQTLAEETHNSKRFTAVFLSLAVVEFFIAGLMPQTSVRLGMGLLGILFLLIAAHTWSGFRYRFTPAGLEISTLGLRLRSIRQSQIANYRPEKWMMLRGYGIRGVGNTRAYVWGNDVVHITTLEGEVFLGTNDPAGLVRDLDRMKQYAHS
jgi:Protein of unknown function (DUF1648)